MEKKIDFNYLLKKDVLLEVLEQEGLHLTKNLGQNFLINGSARDKLSSFVPDNTDLIIEIGCGLGHFTVFLLRKAQKFIGIEVDKGFYNILTQIFKDASKAQFYHEDILKFDISILKEQILNAPNSVIVGNLPYNLSTAILEKILEWDLPIKELFLLFQKEFVSDKLLFRYDDTNLSQLYCELAPFYDIKLLCLVGKQNFFPVPQVDSSFIKLTAKDHPYDSTLKKHYQKYVNMIFTNPKKLLYKQLSQMAQDKNLNEIFQKEGLDEQARIEHLNINQIKNIFEFLYEDLLLKSKIGSQK